MVTFHDQSWEMVTYHDHKMWSGKHTFLRRGIPRPPISGREKPNIVVVKDLISSSVQSVIATLGTIFLN